MKEWAQPRLFLEQKHDIVKSIRKVSSSSLSWNYCSDVVAYITDCTTNPVSIFQRCEAHSSPFSGALHACAPWHRYCWKTFDRSYFGLRKYMFMKSINPSDAFSWEKLYRNKYKYYRSGIARVVHSSWLQASLLISLNQTQPHICFT